MISKLYLSFLETKVCFKTLNLWKQPKGHEFSKNCQERGDRSLISHPSLLKIRVKTSWNSKLSSTDFYIWYLKLTSCFKTRTLKLAFSKFQPWSNTKVKKIYKSKVYTCNKGAKTSASNFVLSSHDPLLSWERRCSKKKGINNSPNWLNKISRLFSSDELTS